MVSQRLVFYCLPIVFCIIVLLIACGSDTAISAPITSQWIWVSGSGMVNVSGVYGTQGEPSTNNTPAGRFGAVGWTDEGGNLWLFGGNENSSGVDELFNDLWEFTPANRTWTWVSGSNTTNASGVYGTQDTSATDNMPGARSGSVSWRDNNGNFLLFGGGGYDSNGVVGVLNDLWEFNLANKTWTWVSGSNTTNASGMYGTQGASSTSNTPGARSGSVSWTDSSGNFWLFGGEGFAPGSMGVLNDLWEFNPANNTWTWVSGSNTANAIGSYGSLGLSSSSNMPGARSGSVSWMDNSGNLWLFGGIGYVSSGNYGTLSDLWEFTPANKTWTWVSGSNITNASGVYRTQGASSTSNTPGARSGSVSWTDRSGNFWLFGGGGYDSTGVVGDLNDLWEFNPTNNTWTWVSGSNTANAIGSYGSLGLSSSTNMPGARSGSLSWTDGSGNFWLFGGEGYGSAGLSGGARGVLNDLWINPL